MARKSPSHRIPDIVVHRQLDEHAKKLEIAFDADVITWGGPIRPPADMLIRKAVEHRKKIQGRHRNVALVLNTNGGYIETAERIADTLRKNYRRVDFVVPDHAMSAGTVLAMAGDEIWMTYYSILGPIDPQVERKGGGDYVPALGYLAKYKELIEKSAKGKLTSVEGAFFVQNFDAAELYQFEQQRDLSIALLEEWLVKYKFRNWKATERRRKRVTPTMRRTRAREIGAKLSDPERWKSHARGITREVLEKQLNLKIRHLEEKPDTKLYLDDYWELLANFCGTIGKGGAVHAIEWFIPIMEA